VAVNPEELLTHAGFVAALARRLVSDEHAGSDVAQQAFLAAIERPPSGGKPLKSWLSRVTRNLSIKHRLAETRRRKRERAYAVPERAPSTDEVIEREEIRRKVVDAVLELDEPYRSTLLLRYYEDLPPRLVAESQKVPLETVKTRLKRGIEQLRSRLDDGHGGSRRKWLFALLPIAGIKLSAAKASTGIPAAVAGGLIMSTNAKISIAAFCAIGVTLTLCTVLVLNEETAPPIEEVVPEPAVLEAEEVVQSPPEPVVDTEPEIIKQPVGPVVAAPVIPSKPERTAIKKYMIDGKVPFGMTLVKGGKVKMGLSADKVIEMAGGQRNLFDFLARSIPEHTVKVDSFFCDLYEVTNAQWVAYLEQTGQEPSPELKDFVWKNQDTCPATELSLPVRCVSCREATRFVRWCGKRIPTEAEWMRAARGDDERIYAWGDDWNAGRFCTNDKNELRPVGSYEKGKSAFDIYDMTGSVWEWTSTKFEAFKGYKPPKLKLGKKKIPAEPAFNAQDYIIKGGNYLAGHVGNQLIIREPSMPVNRLDTQGFRCVKDVQPGMTLFRYAHGDLSALVIGDFEFNTHDMYGIDITHLSEGEPRVITGYDGLMVCPIKELNTTMARIMDESHKKPQPIGILHVTRPLREPDLPAGSYTLAYRHAHPESEKFLKAEKTRLRAEQRVWEKQKREHDQEARRQMIEMGVISPDVDLSPHKTKNLVVFLNDEDWIVGYVEAEPIRDNFGYTHTDVRHFPSGEEADVELGIKLVSGPIVRFKFRIAIKNNPF
jgi:RNA polymerase sigma factor (sigma-70 family)